MALFVQWLISDVDVGSSRWSHHKHQSTPPPRSQSCQQYHLCFVRWFPRFLINMWRHSSLCHLEWYRVSSNLGRLEVVFKFHKWTKESRYLAGCRSGWYSSSFAFLGSFRSFLLHHADPSRKRIFILGKRSLFWIRIKSSFPPGRHQRTGTITKTLLRDAEVLSEAAHFSLVLTSRYHNQKVLNFVLQVGRTQTNQTTSNQLNEFWSPTSSR